MRGALVAWIVVVAACGRTAVSPCEEAARRRDPEATVARCSADRGPREAIRRAEAHDALGDSDEAEALARRLLDGPEAGLAHRLLGKLARDRGDYPTAIDHARRALALQPAPAQAAYDAMELARAQRKRAAWIATMVAADRALVLALRAGDHRNRCLATLTRAMALRAMGDPRRAEATLADAAAIANHPCDRARVSLERGHLLSLDAPARARRAFDEAAAAPGECAIAPGTIAVNQAWLAYEEGDLDRTEALLADGDGYERRLIRARVAARRGDLIAAAAHLDHAEALGAPSDDWPWELAFLRAQIAEAAGDRITAEAGYRRALAEIAELRSRAAAGDPFSVSRFRQVYDGLIALLADQGRWRDALEVILDLDAGDMLRSFAPASRGTAGDSATGVAGATAARPAIDDVLAAWRGRDLTIALAASPREIGAGGERVYRIAVRDGAIEGAAIGDAAQASAWAAALYAHPDDRAAAIGLGPLLVPPGASDRPLYLLLVGTLGRVPPAALRDADGALVIARRPLARVLSLRPHGPRAPATAAAAVLADPTGDLVEARREGTASATVLGVRAHVGAEATRAALWSAAGAVTLHVAAHVDDDGTGPTLRLADGPVTSAELVAHGVAPGVAVIAACGAAAATDLEGWGSLAQAFLTAGAGVVIAADRSVDDARTGALMRAFYAEPTWRDDPIGALARAQLASDDLATAAAFTALAGPP